MAINLTDAAIFDSLPVGVLILNQSKQLSYCNEAFANILRTPHRRLKPGSPLSKNLPKSSELFDLLEMEKGHHREITLSLPSGNDPTVRVTCQDVSIGQEVHFLLYVLDISIEKHLHEKYKTLSKDSAKDDKTGLFNSGYFEKAFHEDFSSQQNLGLVIIDIDHFKHVNDTHGHLIGDHVLKKVADVIKASVPSGALAARYGGEEFCVLLKNSSEKELMELSDSIRRKIEGSEVPGGKENQFIKVTVSTGASVKSPQIISSRVLFENADEALYEAKNSGRNKSIFKA